MSWPSDHIEDKGQRYKVVALDARYCEINVGYTEEADGGALVESVNLNPRIHSPRVIDRKPEIGES